MHQAEWCRNLGGNQGSVVVLITEIRTTTMQEYGTAADVFSFGVVLWELVTLEQPWYNDHERPGLCSRIMPEVHGGNQLFVIRQVPLGVRLPLPAAQDVEPPLPDLPAVRLLLLPLLQHKWSGRLRQRSGSSYCRLPWLQLRMPVVILHEDSQFDNSRF